MTPWKHSYKGNQTQQLADELRRKRRREINRTGAQALQSQHWDKVFELNRTAQVARKPHPDDKALGDIRRAAEEALEDKELRESLKEVWD